MMSWILSILIVAGIIGLMVLMVHIEYEYDFPIIGLLFLIGVPILFIIIIHGLLTGTIK